VSADHTDATEEMLLELLKKEERLQAVTIRHLEERGITKFGWVKPNEYFDGLAGDGRWPHGAFIYETDQGQLHYCKLRGKAEDMDEGSKHAGRAPRSRGGSILVGAKPSALVALDDKRKRKQQEAQRRQARWRLKYARRAAVYKAEAHNLLLRAVEEVRTVRVYGHTHDDRGADGTRCIWYRRVVEDKYLDDGVYQKIKQPVVVDGKSVGYEPVRLGIMLAKPSETPHMLETCTTGVGEGALGLKWVKVGEERPDGVELTNANLSKALARRTEFSVDEGQAFGLEGQLGPTHFIRGADGFYFKLAEEPFHNVNVNAGLWRRLRPSELDNRAGGRISMMSNRLGLKHTWHVVPLPEDLEAEGPLTLPDVKQGRLMHLVLPYAMWSEHGSNISFTRPSRFAPLGVGFELYSHQLFTLSLVFLLMGLVSLNELIANFTDPEFTSHEFENAHGNDHNLWDAKARPRPISP
jgi:hypothetical protein